MIDVDEIARPYIAGWRQQYDGVLDATLHAQIQQFLDLLRRFADAMEVEHIPEPIAVRLVRRMLYNGVTTEDVQAAVERRTREVQMMRKAMYEPMQYLIPSALQGERGMNG